MPARSEKIKCRFCGKKSPSCLAKRQEMLSETRESAHALSPTPTPPPEQLTEDFSNNDQGMDIDPPDHGPELEAPVPNVPPLNPPPAHRGVSIEEVEDEDAPGAARWIEDCDFGSLPAGCVLEQRHPVDTVFEAIRRKQEEEGLPPWAPFESEEDWDLARWLSKSGVSGGNIDEFLKLKKCEMFEITGDEKDAQGELKKEEVEFWKRDPVECIKELMGNAAFREQMRYAPQKVYRDAEGKRREFDEMWTGDWWWKLQQLLPEGVTICPVILASDKTQLSRFSGDKQAWPVYLSIGNIAKDTRRKPTQRATVLLGYIPVCKLHCFSKANRSAAGYQLFHQMMRNLLQSLVKAGKDGVDMLCADGNVRRVHPILAAYIADYPEQCLVACCKENRCPKCVVDPKKRGMPVYSALRDPAETIKLMKKEARGLAPKQFKAQGLRAGDPFWKDLPHCDIFECFTPDILHQLHKGVFKEHIVSWATESLGGLRHFKTGISLVSQWTGNEYKGMEKVFLGVLNGAADPQVIRAVRAILDFIYYAHFETHTNESLAKLEDAWNLFHANKEIFITKEIREHFNIPKIHSMKHYVDMIRALGTADGYNTELSERLHIDCAKLGYGASSKKDYTVQMTRFLMRREAIDRFASYLQWAIPGYLVQLNDAAETSDDDEDEAEEEEEEPITAPDSASSPLAPTFTIAKTAPFPRVTIGSLEAEYGAKDFLSHLENFLRAESLLPRRFGDISATFAIYKRVVIKIPAVVQVSTSITNDPVRATRSTPSRGLKRAVPAHFDTILAYKEKPTTVPKRSSLEGLFPGRVRAIFALPVEYGRFPTPLASDVIISIRTLQNLKGFENIGSQTVACARESASLNTAQFPTI
ncbi:hypothetical protein C8J57DRAFT_1727328 [Mycena rebaudengoi]|nr:hypothetical protein C8J57DRAFT_1727328 [Mycena rebaudengoi]